MKKWVIVIGVIILVLFFLFGLVDQRILSQDMLENVSLEIIAIVWFIVGICFIAYGLLSNRNRE